jgi:uncharacterized membrane protein (DUF4010 family)
MTVGRSPLSLFRRLNRKDVYAGLTFAVIGAAFAGVAAAYPLGAATRMGPGWFPLILGGLLTVLGIAVVFSGRSAADRDQAEDRGGQDAAPPFAWRPLVHVGLAVVAFALLIEPGGLVVASAALVLLGAGGGWEFHWGEATALAGSLTVLAVGLFAFALHVPLPVWPV